MSQQNAPQSVPQPVPQRPLLPQTSAELRPEHLPTSVGDDGRIAWALGLLGFLSFPGIAILATSIAMLVAGLVQRKRNPVARSVGTRAALFGAVSLLMTVLFFGFGFGVLVPLGEAGIIGDDTIWPAFILVPLGLWVVVAGPITAIVMGIIALAKPFSPEKLQALYAKAGR